LGKIFASDNSSILTSGAIDGKYLISYIDISGGLEKSFANISLII